MLPYKFRGVAGIRNLTERWAAEKFLAPVLALALAIYELLSV